MRARVLATLVVMLVFFGCALALMPPGPTGFVGLARAADPTSDQLSDQDWNLRTALDQMRRDWGWASTFSGPATGSGSGNLAPSPYATEGVWTEVDNELGPIDLVIEVVVFHSAAEAASTDKSGWTWWPGSGEALAVGPHTAYWSGGNQEAANAGWIILSGSIGWICGSPNDNLAVVCHGSWEVEKSKADLISDLKDRLVNVAQTAHTVFVQNGVCGAGTAGGSTGGTSGGGATTGSTSGGGATTVTSSGGGTPSGGSSGGVSGGGGSDDNSPAWIFAVMGVVAFILLLIAFVTITGRRRARRAKSAAAGPPPMTEGWYVDLGNGPAGPYPWAALQEMTRTGALRGTNLVWHPATQVWVSAGTVPNLF